ncbi:MAG: hypothetical protein LBH31_04335, partial [Burkholderiaceae bacterium]|nr:hypothetical protein [Burkholderiaceae bacterium]
GGGAGIGSDGNNYSANSADRKVGTIKIDTIGTVNATGGKGFRGGGPGENIGQGGGPGGSATKP